MLSTIEEHGSKIDRNSVFNCHLSAVGRQMAIENSVSNVFYIRSAIVLTLSIAAYPVCFKLLTCNFQPFYYLHGLLMWMKNSVDSDELASTEVSWSGSDLFSKDGIINWKSKVGALICSNTIFLVYKFIQICGGYISYLCQLDHSISLQTL